jgi:Fur family transcriptional regulator, ferric uptake regulator
MTAISRRLRRRPRLPILVSQPTLLQSNYRQSAMSGNIDIEALCAERGLRITDQRRTIARVLSTATDHPDVDELHRRSAAIDPRISIATVYRTVRLFEESGILERHDFRDGRSRYEAVPDEHHDHLIDIESGKVIEFHDDELEELQARIAERLGFVLVDHRMELYGKLVKAAGKG